MGGVWEGKIMAESEWEDLLVPLYLSERAVN